ncbi:MAG: hypothetical protein OXH86_06995, partial [Acidimicrobiaceae bacterium]|nr:hypothetical protein [Acidimicrobiaceae bacterium]
MVVQERHRLPDTTPNIAEQAEPTGEASTSSMVPPGRRGFRFLYVVDAVTLFALMVAITVVRFGFDWPTYPRTHYLIGFGVATFLHMTVYYFGGLYEF